MEGKYVDWITGSDTGTSSITIILALNGRPAPRYGFDIPYDMGDLGRCIRMLEKFPELEARLPELPAILPMWTPYVDCWRDLKRKYTEVNEWYTKPETERKAHLRKKHSSDPGKEAYQYMKRLEAVSRYLGGWRPQGSLDHWKRGEGIQPATVTA
ncbi:hypothetical protein SAMN04488069_12916 [Hymenobacter psychrophilus]|uniref:Uncharacterized protein n=2 Tax=Hymenobacter psychrophilus TaxID=651662 RepID=A0A1H3PE11_9BACT|nr:hypothetical protein SAMN04488069_12916 [Hymenobacter psychrophilus]